MKPAFNGVDEKLKRADENIRNLDTEVCIFFQNCKYPVMPKINSKEHDDALKYFKTLFIPPRLSVLAGEIAHHLRSCMDHIIWELSDDATRNDPKAARYLEFPILAERPTPENKFTSYGRKIKGVAHSGALKFIEELQPYNRTPFTDDPLWLIHHMNVIDKHRELVVTHCTGYMEGPLFVIREMQAHLIRKTPIPAALKSEFDQHGQITPQVSFGDFPGWKAQPIIPTLAQLAGYIDYTAIQFKKIVS